MRKERYAAFLILLAFFSGMLITAATSGCDTHTDFTAQGQDAGSDMPLSEDSGSI